MQRMIRNIAIMAHADAGKTTITEHFLFLSGLIRQPGNVDQGTTTTDFLPVEKERGISVRSAHISFQWNGININLVDTPGHVDFSSDVEKVMRVVDGVILVISAVEGVQANTEILFNALHKHRIPLILFINKIDRVGADSHAVIQSLEKELNVNLICLQELSGEGCNDAGISQIWSEEYMHDQLIENIVAGNECLMTKYLDGCNPSFVELDNQLSHLVRSNEVCPVLFGSAKLGLGIKELMDAVVKYLPPPSGHELKPLSALVYGISRDKNNTKVAMVRVFNGAIANRDVIFNFSRKIEDKVTQVQKIFSGRYNDTAIVKAGDIAGICGLNNAQIGDLLGSPDENIPDDVKLKTPLIIVRVKELDQKDYTALAAALQDLNEEDPALSFEWLREESELQVKIMGWIQMEILERILSDRFGIKAKFENPTVIYKETPSSIGEGFVRYWMPKPCWAIMKFRIEPAERGSGVIYQSIVSVNEIQQKYQNEVERAVSTAMKQGIKGWEVTDIKITLIEGEDHPVHSRPGDFTVATPMGIMEGLVNTGTTLLEPVVRFKIQATEELLGAVTSDITRMRGSFESPVMDNGSFSLQGIFPLATSIDYPVKLSSRSGGKAKISTFFYGYSECTDEQGVIRPYNGISPLDTAKYILKARKALK